MSHSIRTAFIFFTVVLLFFSSSSAAVLAATLKTVGTVSVEGSSFAQLWFTGTTPTLAGDTTPGTSVSVSVDGQIAAAIVDASGNWTYPLNLSVGDHLISLSSDGVVFSSFTLTIGEDAPEGTIGNATDSSTDTLPVTGAAETTLVIALFGVLLVIGSRFLPRHSA